MPLRDWTASVCVLAPSGQSAFQRCQGLGRTAPLCLRAAAAAAAAKQQLCKHIYIRAALMTLCWSPRSGGRADISNTFVFAVAAPRAETLMRTDSVQGRTFGGGRWRRTSWTLAEAFRKWLSTCAAEETIRPNLEGAVVYKKKRRGYK